MGQGITVTDTFTLDTPELQAAGEKMKNAMMLAADRAVMHFAEPTKYPIDPTPGSAEQLFLAHLMSRKPAVQKIAVAKTTASLGTPARAARLGALAEVDLRSKTPVLEQAEKVLGWAAQIQAKPGAPHPGPPAPPAPFSADAANAAVRVRIRSVTCVDNTDPDWGADDMIVGGSIVNDKGSTFQIGQSVIGEMDEDDAPLKLFQPPKVFARCSLSAGIKGSLEGSSWPKLYIATVVLCEQDNGGFPDWLNKLLDFVEGKVVAWAGATLGATIGSLIGTPAFPGLGTAIGAGIGALVGWLLDGIIGFFKSWWEDDVMPPITTQCKIDHYQRPGTVITTVQPWHMKGQGGEYKVELDWQVNFPSHFADKLDCALNLDNGKCYFFAGTKYMRFDVNEGSVDAGYPKDIADGWPGLWKQGARAGILWNNGKIYFFKGDEYMRVDAATKKADAGYPKKIKDSSWKALWHDGIDAAVMKLSTGKAYFFKGEEYIRWDVASNKPDPGYPTTIAGNWHGSFAKNVDAALEYNQFAMIFKGASFVQYNMDTNAALGGAQDTDYFWPGL